jgi:hypothetical protein
MTSFFLELFHSGAANSIVVWGKGRKKTIKRSFLLCLMPTFHSNYIAPIQPSWGCNQIV